MAYNRIVETLIVQLLKHPAASARSDAAGRLGELNTAAKVTVPALIEALLKDEDAIVRAAAAQALRWFGDEAKPRRIALVQALEDADPEVRRQAAGALGAMLEKAEPAIPSLVKSLKDPEDYVRWEAAFALYMIGSEIGSRAQSAVPALIESLADPFDKVRQDAARALNEIDPGAGLSEGAT